MSKREQRKFFGMPEQKRQEYIRQRELILEFDQKLCKCKSNGMEPVEALAKGVYIVLIAMVMWIPFDMEELSTIALCVLGVNIWPTWIYMSRYLHVNENGKLRSIYEKLRYMPVDERIVRRTRMEYLVKFLKLPLITALAMQVIGAMLCNHGITIANIIYPIVVMGVYPALIGWADILTAKYTNRTV